MTLACIWTVGWEERGQSRSRELSYGEIAGIQARADGGLDYTGTRLRCI